MAIATDQIETLEDLLERIGNVPLSRIRARPAPGTATEADVLGAVSKAQRHCELVEGVLVEKPMGLLESYLAGFFVLVLSLFVDARNLGIVTGADGAMRLFPGLVRIPDAAFISWGRIPGGRLERVPFSASPPDLVVEVLSPSNTKAEMELKRHQYFEAGVRLLWYVDLDDRTVTVHRPGDDSTVLDEVATLDGGEVLPGFELPLRDLFSRLDRTPG